MLHGHWSKITCWENKLYNPGTKEGICKRPFRKTSEHTEDF